MNTRDFYPESARARDGRDPYDDSHIEKDDPFRDAVQVERAEDGSLSVSICVGADMAGIPAEDVAALDSPAQEITDAMLDRIAVDFDLDVRPILHAKIVAVLGN